MHDLTTLVKLEMASKHTIKGRAENVENNMNVMNVNAHATDMKIRIEIKLNTVRCQENRPLCGNSFKPEMMCAWPFLGDSWHPICERCAAERDLHFPYPCPAPPSEH